MSFSRGQKISVRSSPECELDGIDDTIPQIMWGKYFIEAYGWTVEHNVLYQDNELTILLATNRRSSRDKTILHGGQSDTLIKKYFTI